jgi:hypothetical protein
LGEPPGLPGLDTELFGGGLEVVVPLATDDGAPTSPSAAGIREGMTGCS